MSSETLLPPPEFLLPETRCGHYVTAATKSLWQVQLALLAEFIRICKRHDLEYQLLGGSLLGAMRHQGYIPWDDDIDIGMLRPDYDRFLQVASAELPPHLFLQTTLSEREYLYGFAKLRNSCTAAIEHWRVKEHRATNQGIFIDILPLDDVPAAPAPRRHLMELYSHRLMVMMQLHETPCRARTLRGLARKLRAQCFVAAHGGWQGAYTFVEDTFRNFHFSPDAPRLTGQGTWGALHNCYEKAFWPYEAIHGECIDMPFEYLTVRVPKEYDQILTTSFGDWRTPVKGKPYHTILEYDTTRSYREVLIEKYGYTAHDFVTHQ